MVCYPTEDGMNVEAGTQHIDSTQTAIAQACGLGKNKYVSLSTMKPTRFLDVFLC